MKTDLLTVPGIGKNIKQDLIDIGIDCVEALRGQDPELLYQKDCEHKGRIEDRCQLYVLRCAVYYADHTARGKSPDPQKCRWWYWKEHVYPSSDDTESLFPSTKVR